MLRQKGFVAGHWISSRHDSHRPPTQALMILLECLLTPICPPCTTDGQLMSRQFTYVTPILKSIHWLEINERIEYKILSLRPTYKLFNTTQPAYLHDLI